ncbi:MAG: Alpha/beta hydrolase fold-3 domain protein [Burkholderiaceae bacterium]|nr:Alpha/beta hydrolase fold-3 domain protein [Burkholderiaceae bacterium]
MLNNYLLVLLMLLPLSARAGSETDLAYGREAGQSLDIYHPDRCLAARCPVVMWVHGGGWRNGDKGNNGAKDLAATWENAGAVVVTLNYRLTPDVVHPAHVQDVAAGIAWTRANIGRYGGDPQRLFLQALPGRARTSAATAATRNDCSCSATRRGRTSWRS